MSSKNPEKSLQRSESHLFTSTAKETNRKLLKLSTKTKRMPFLKQENSATPIQLRFKELCGGFYPYTSVSEQETKVVILDDFTFNKFVFRTRGSLLLSELLASSRIRHGGSPLSASHRKYILLSEIECHIINNLLTELAWAVLGNIGPRSWQYGPRFARSVLPRPRANIP